ncbi:MAG TPA: hypothetical protein VG960_00950, partial [Caulobacteraceae bacterium]|nr:hypothetical protein [Caulobacteraceae bacterium]
PVLTSPGESFASAEAAGAVKAAGLNSLVAETLEEYERLAKDAGSDPAVLGALKSRLASNRWTWPLLDAGQYIRHLECAYETMCATSRRGEAPQSFDVKPLF